MKCCLISPILVEVDFCWCFGLGLHFSLIVVLHLVLAIVYDSPRDTMLLYTVLYQDQRL